MSVRTQQVIRGNGCSPRPIDADEFRSITICDRYGEDKKRPRAIVHDGHASFITIDILASVAAAARNVGHPAILSAIERWEKLSRAENVVNRSTARLSRLAEAHLKRFCEALLTGVKKRKVSHETAQVFAENGRLVEKEYQYLKVAWKLMTEAKFKTIRKRYGAHSCQSLEFVEEGLMQEVRKEVSAYKQTRESERRPFKEEEEAKLIYNWSWPVIQILDYLQTDKGRGGLKQRKSWETTKGNYRLWRFRLPHSDNARTNRRRSKEKEDWPDFDVSAVEKDTFFFPTDAQVIEEETKIIVDFWKENWPLIKQTVEHVLSDIKIIVGAVLKVIQVFWQEHGEAIKAIVHSAWEIVKTISVTGLKIVLDVIKLGMQIYNDNWRGAWETTKNIGSLAVHAVGQIVRGLVNILFEIIKDIARAIINAVVDLGRRAEALGHAIIDGMVRGIKSGISAVINAAKDMGSAAITAAKAMLRSQSPSQVFHEIGRDVAQGFINGIQSSKAAVQNVMRELVAAPSLQGVSLGKLKPPQLSRAAGIAEGDEERRFKTETDEAKRAFAERTLADEQYVGRLIKADEKLLNSKLAVITAERAEARATIADQNELALKLAELRSREADHVAEHKATVQQIIDEKNGRARDAALAHQRALDAIAEMAAAREIERIKGLAEQGYISEVAAERHLQELREEGFAREQKALDKELAAATENLAEHQRITDELTVLDARRAASAEQSMRRIIAASNKQIEGSLPDGVPGLPAVQTPQKTQKKGRRQSAVADNNFGLPDPPKLKETETAMQGITRALGEVKAIAQEAFGQLAQGAGQMLSNWVLLGDAGPHALRKMTAQILASLSAQATVEAIMETARGLAALANPLLAWTAPGHFAAAAVFASVAGVAAIAGRGLAGDLFKTDARGANGGKQKDSNAAGGRALGDGANGGSSTASRQATIIEENRRSNTLPTPNPRDAALVKALDRLNGHFDRIEPVTSEGLFRMGAKKAPEAVTDAVHSQYYNSSTKLNNVLQDASKRSW